MSISEKDYDLIWNVNVKSVFFFIKESLDLLKASTGGANILMTSSIAGFQPERFLGVYSTTKSALINLATWLSQELMDDGIRVNCINPGMTRTPMMEKEMKMGFDKKNPRAVGNPEQIASVAAMICSKDGSFVNGESYVVNGGFYRL